MISWLRSRKVRSGALQASYILIILALLITVYVVTRRNLDRQGIAVGWDFLNYSTGWDIPFSVIRVTSSDTYGRMLAAGFLNTIVLGLISIVLSMVLGTIIGAARLSSNKLLSALALCYVQLIRNVPLILQTFFWYAVVTNLPSPRSAPQFAGAIFLSNRGFYLPALNVSAIPLAIAGLLAAVGICMLVRSARLTGHINYLILLITLVCVAAAVLFGKPADMPWINLPLLQGLRITGGIAVQPEFGAAILAISLFGAAYVAEIVRGGFLSVPNGLIEAGSVLGLKVSHIFFLIRLPLAIRIILPIISNQSVAIMKATTIAVVIGFSEFFGVVLSSITKSGQTISLMMILVIGFGILNSTISFGLNLVNRSLALPGVKK